jgi:ADP-dependent phosphofructokinase/glucokinase
MDDMTWQKLYDDASSLLPDSVIVGFNVNLDRIITVDEALLGSALFNQPVLSELRSRLLHSMHTCTAEEWFVTDPLLYEQFNHIFSDTGHLSIGGQAGIAAVHLASAGIADVLCITHSPGPDTRKIIDSAGVHLLALDAGYAPTSDTIHLIFEYLPGIVPVTDGVIPRNNRFIVSPLHPPASVLIPVDTWNTFRARIIRFNRAFLSGYQYLRTEREFGQAADQCLLMKKNNEHLRIHVECVSVTDPGVISGFIRHILPVADSIGLNEHELVLLHHFLFSPNTELVGFEIVSPVQRVKCALEICKNSGLKRLHLHTFGYYVLVLRNEYVHTEASLNALLFASCAVTRAAQGTDGEISPAGMSAYNEVEKVFGPQISLGVFRDNSHTIIMIPTIIVKTIAKSSGLGDIISSSAFVADPF